MPIRNLRDKSGPYFQFGKTGHKYYYHRPEDKPIAYEQVLRQARAIEASKHRRKKL